MRNAFLAAALMVVFMPQLHADPVRERAEDFVAAMPEQQALDDFLTPATTADEEDQAEQAQERAAKIDELEKALVAAPSGLKGAALMAEIIPLHEAQATWLRDKAQRDFVQAYDAWWTGQTLAPAVPNYEAARNELLKKTNVLRNFVADFTRDPRLAEMTFQLAHTMARLGNDHAEYHFSQLLRQFPDTPWGVKGRIARADSWTGQGKLDEAINEYKAINKTVTPELKPYAQYRLGWAFVAKAFKVDGKPRAEFLQKAEAAFKLVILTFKDKKEETRWRMRSEAAFDLAWLYAKTGDEKAATEFFTKQEMPQMLPLFREKLADEWVRQGKIDKALAFYREWITKNPADGRVPDFYVKLCRALLHRGDAKGFDAEMEKLAALTTAKEAPWFKAHENDAKAIERVTTMRESLGKTVGFQFFDGAQQEKDAKKKTELLEQSIRYLDKGLKSTTAPDQLVVTRFTMASAMLLLGKIKDALAQFDEVIKLKPKEGTYLVDSTYNRMMLLSKMDSEQPQPKLPEPGKARTPIELPDLKKKFALAVDDYLKLAPGAEIEPNLRYEVAYTLYLFGRYDEAMPKLEALVHAFPRTDQAKASVELLLTYQVDHGRWDELLRLSTELLNDRNIKGKQLRDYIQQNLEFAKSRKGG